MDKLRAIDGLRAVVPEFAPDYRESVGHPSYGAYGDLLLHVVMGDLGRFYMERARPDHDLAARFWRVVEELACTGDDGVQNAVHVSLIEWFAWGDDAERRDHRNHPRPTTADDPRQRRTRPPTLTPRQLGCCSCTSSPCRDRADALGLWTGSARY